MSVLRPPVYVAGWLVAGGLLVVALARWVAWDSHASLVALNALTPVLFLPAWPVAFLAALRRRWALFGTAGAAVGLHVMFVAPEILAAEAVPDSARAGRAFTVFSANVYAGNDDVEGYAAEIRRNRPDIVVLQEATPALLSRLAETGAVDDLPHRVTVARHDPFAAAVLSRWPVTAHDVLALRGRPVLIRATVQLAGTPIRVFAVHAVSPFGGARQEWISDLEAIRGAVAAEREPVLVAGDLNATWGHRHFRRLLDSGLTDAAAARGRAFSMTWPRNRRIAPPLVRIDHVLTSRGLVVTRITTGAGRGSDHRPLIARVALTERASGPAR